MHTMSATVQGIFFTIAVVCFLLATLAQARAPRVNLIALGLAAFVFVAAWNAWSAS